MFGELLRSRRGGGHATLLANAKEHLMPLHNTSSYRRDMYQLWLLELNAGPAGQPLTLAGRMSNIGNIWTSSG